MIMELITNQVLRHIEHRAGVLQCLFYYNDTWKLHYKAY